MNPQSLMGSNLSEVGRTRIPNQQSRNLLFYLIELLYFTFKKIKEGAVFNFEILTTGLFL